MSGVTPQPVWDFRRALRSEGITISQLATFADVNRCHLSQVLNARRSGGRTWGAVREAVSALAPAVLPVLDKLQQFATWNAPAGMRPWLVRTEAGLAVHRSAGKPALADDREIGAEHFGKSDVKFSCATRVGAKR
jgi:hypothetical protein